MWPLQPALHVPRSEQKPFISSLHQAGYESVHLSIAVYQVHFWLILVRVASRRPTVNQRFCSKCGEEMLHGRTCFTIITRTRASPMDGQKKKARQQQVKCAVYRLLPASSYP